ncbi:MAG TPA: PAS domain S-box protein [Gaiellaceae bacterium]|nr:PAS domain S-box protein [Gaiellaceae bacterium]
MGRALDTRVSSGENAVRAPEANGFPRAAQLYLFGLVLATALGAGLALAPGAPSTGDLVTFAILAACAAVAQFFLVGGGSYHGLHTAIAFVIAGALLLPPELVVLMALVQHLPHGLKQRYPWYIQTFNIANYGLAALAAWGAAHLVAATAIGDSELRFALTGAAASVVWILVNHSLLATMLRLARGTSYRESGLFSPKTMAMDLVVASLGVALVSFWRSNPWLMPAVIAPLVVSHRSLSILSMLRDSEERFRAMFDSAAIGTGVLDLEGRIVTSNRALEEMLGFTKEELESRTAVELTHPDDRTRELQLFGELAEGKREEYRLEKRCLAKGGDVVWGHHTVSLVRDGFSRPKFAIAMLEDITPRRQAEEARLRLESQLRQAQKMEAVGQLAGGVAHDFNNLLTAIRGYSEFALNRLGDGNESIRKDIEEIAKSADRASSLTRQLLAFSRKQLLQPRILQLNDVVGEVDKMLRRLIGEDIEVVTVFGRALGRVKADPGQIEQVLVNLVVNARDAMPDGGKLTIETTNVDVDDEYAAAHEGLAAGNYVMLAVHDTGHGIDIETKSRLFEPFFTTKEQGKGTGLGLATVYGIVKQSGGYIVVESEPGKGAAFKVFLHRLEAGANAVEHVLHVVEERPRGSETVLLVEDEEVVRNLVREILEGNGYTVLEARNGAEALDLGRRFKGPIHLLVTDVVMPKMSGRELAERLVTIHRETRILYMSGYTDGAIGQHGVLDPETELLQKPFSFDELAQKVRKVIDAPPATVAA